jgi:signal peptidase complex subunit 2
MSGSQNEKGANADKSKKSAASEAPALNQAEENEDGVEEEEEVKKPEAHVIETGDSVKVKQVLDDSTHECIIEKCGFVANYSAENLKLFLMFLSCIFALTAQFYPLPFPESRPILGVCVSAYFIISGILQFIVSFIDLDLILTTKPGKSYSENEKKIVEKTKSLCIRTQFARFQETFILIVHEDGKGKHLESNKERSEAHMYVGKYFTDKGEYDEEAYHKDVITHIKRFEEGKYGVIKYNHEEKSKTD